MNNYYPPTPDEWQRIPAGKRIYLFALAWWHCRVPKLMVPTPVHLGILTSLFTFLLITIMPVHPMAIPVSFGGGLSLALISIGGKRGGK